MVDVKLISLIAVNMLSNLCYTVIVPFLPIQFNKFGLDVKWYGYVFGIYALAVLLTSLIVGKLLSVCSRKSVLIFGIVSMGFSMIGFALIVYLTSHNSLISVCLFMRSLQGFSSGVIQTTSYAIIAVWYTEQQQKYLGVLEASMGLGMLVGPAVGSVLYTLFEFKNTFYILGASFLVWAPLLKALIPESVNASDPEQVDIAQTPLTADICSNQIDSKQRISYLDLMSEKVFCLTAISAFMAYFEYCYTEPVLAIRIMEFKISPFWIGIFFCINAVSYTLMSLIISKITDKYDNKIVITWGLFLTGISHLFVGPSHLLPDSLMIMAVGQFLFGGFSILFLITSLPDMIKLAQRYPHQKCEASDMSSGVFNWMLGIGQMIGPIYGSYVTGEFDFRIWATSMAVILLVYAGIYYLGCVFGKKQGDMEWDDELGHQEMKNLEI